VDCRCEYAKKNLTLASQEAALAHLICPDFLYQKTAIITQRKNIDQPRDAFEDTACKPGFENVQF
jgi:hypothetical protein